jgi:DNA-binding Lrp family transcriptional regulator
VRKNSRGRSEKRREPSQVSRPLDMINRNILKILRDDARTSLSELAKKVKVSRAAVYARVGRLTDEGVIRGFTIHLDPKKAGLGIAALITVDVDQARWRSVQKELASLPEVEWCAAMAGEFDAVILVRAPDIETVRDVVLERLNAIDGIRRTQTLFVLDEAVPHRVVVP